MTAVSRKLITLGVILSALTCILPVKMAFSATAPLVKVIDPPIKTGISAPIKIATDRFGNFYLTDPRGGGILKYNSSGSLIATLPVKTPQGIAVTQGGDLIVGQGTFVSVLDNTGKEKFKLGKGAGQFKMANGIALDAAGFIYVVDSLDNCIQVFNAAGATVTTGNAATGKPANSFGTTGKLPGQFSIPTGITFEKSSKQLAVVDTLNGRVQFFNTAGTFLKSIGSTGSGPLKFTSPQAVAFEYSKDTAPVLMRMYVVDSFQSNVQVLDPAGTGTQLGFIGVYGAANGKLVVPSDVLFDPLGNRLLVVNGFGNLTVYGINGGTTPIADTTPPVLAVAPPPTITSSSSVTISGTVEAEAVVTITTNTAATAAPVVLSTPTTWSSTISGLVNGANEITVTATDRAANASQKKVTVTFDPLATTLAINPVTTPTNSTTQTITGTMDAGATIAITSNTTATAGPVSNPTPTTWSSTITGLVAGDTLITVTASKAGSDSAVASVIITLNTTPPSLTVSTISSNSTTSSSVLNVTGLTDPAVSTVKVNGQTANAVDGVFSTALLLSGGANTVTVIASDPLGNTTTDTRTITYDPASPAVTITVPTDGANINTSTVTVSGTAPANSTTVVKVNGIAQASLNSTTWSTTVSLNQLVGIYTIEAATTDNLTGKTADAKCTMFLNDLTKPPLAVTSPTQDRMTNDPNFPVTGTTVADSVSATINGVSIPVDFQPLGSDFGITPNLTTEDKYTLAITAVDALGNSTTTFRTLFYKITPPNLAVTTQTPSFITGTGDTGSVLTIKDKNGTVVATATIDNSGSWSVTLTGSEAAPLNISATDAAGNNTRNGDINSSSGKPDLVDALKAMRIAMGFDVATSDELLRGDVAPLINGVPTPDGKIDTGDVLVILRKVVGLTDF